MSSVGVVVITSALHAVGHGFETHTEYCLSCAYFYLHPIEFIWFRVFIYSLYYIRVFYTAFEIISWTQTFLIFYEVIRLFALVKFPAYTPGFYFQGPEIFHISDEIFIFPTYLGNMTLIFLAHFRRISGISPSKKRKSPKRPQK